MVPLVQMWRADGQVKGEAMEAEETGRERGEGEGLETS